MRHDSDWVTLMILAIFLLLIATGNAQALFFVSAIGLLGAVLAYRQRVDRKAISVAVTGAVLAFVAAVCLVLLHMR